MGESGPGQGGRGLTRAELIKRAGVMGAAAALPFGTVGAGTATAAPATEAAETMSQLKALTAAEAETLEAVLERLIPTDETGPGAKEANVLRYVDWALAGDLAVFRPAYTEGIAAIDAYAQSRFGSAFATLAPDDQDAVLSDMETGVATGFSPSAKAVFELFRTHAWQGMFGDPAHGGNVGYVGWKLGRFPGPRLVIDAHDQRLDVVPGAHLRSTYSYKLFKNTKRRA